MIAKFHDYFESQSFISTLGRSHFANVISFIIAFGDFDLLDVRSNNRIENSTDFLLFINGLIRFAHTKIIQKPHTKAFKQWTRHEYGIINNIRHMINGHRMAAAWMTQKESLCFDGWCSKPFGNTTLPSYKIHRSQATGLVPFCSKRTTQNLPRSVH